MRLGIQSLLMVFCEWWVRRFCRVFKNTHPHNKNSKNWPRAWQIPWLKQALNIWFWRPFSIGCLPQLPRNNSRNEMNSGTECTAKYHLPLFPSPKPQTTPGSRSQTYNKYLSPSNHFRTFPCVTQVGIFIFWIIGLPYKSHTLPSTQIQRTGDLPRLHE